MCNIAFARTAFRVAISKHVDGKFPLARSKTGAKPGHNFNSKSNTHTDEHMYRQDLHFIKLNAPPSAERTYVAVRKHDHEHVAYTTADDFSVNASA